MRARLQGVQDNVNLSLSGVEAVESQLAPLRNALPDLVELAEMKRDSIMAQARARELQPVDSCGFGSWTWTYDNEGCKLYGQFGAAPVLSHLLAQLPSLTLPPQPPATGYGSYPPPAAGAAPPQPYNNP